MKTVTRIYRRAWNLLSDAQNFCRIVHFRLLGVKVGRNCRIYSGVRISGNVRIGDDVRIGSYTYINTYADGQVTIGNDVLIGSLSHIVSGHARVDISDHCIFAPNTYISDSTHDTENAGVLTKHATVKSEPVTIGENVWLGVAVAVLKGVTIGEGSVIGAKSLVNKAVPPYSVAVGTPATVMRTRR